MTDSESILRGGCRPVRHVLKVAPQLLRRYGNLSVPIEEVWSRVEATEILVAGPVSEPASHLQERVVHLARPKVVADGQPFQSQAPRQFVATDGNARLGGIDWDQCLMRWIDAQFALNHSIRPLETPGGEEFLWREAEEIKHALSTRRRVDVRIGFEGRLLRTEISREEFEEITAHLLDRTRFTVSKLISDSGLNWIEIDKIILVGGSTRMPQVQAMLLRESGMEPDGSVSADEAVAHGAAIYAATLSGSGQNEQALDLKITDVNAHNLGVLGVDKQTGSRCNHVMITRNSPLPASHATRFETIHDNQPSVAVEVIEGGDARGQHATQIGRCVIHDLPPDLPAGTPVDVVFRYDTDGLINVKAMLPTCGHKATLRIDRASGLSNEDRDKMRDIHQALGLDPDD
jgi:molecular chaperone DnaK